MKSKVLPSLLLIASLSVCTIAHATLIGDMITISLHEPLGVPAFSANTVVQAGTADQVSLIFPQWLVNPEASSVNVTNSGNLIEVGPSSFVGLVVSEINDTITGFSISTNLVGWTDSRFAFNAHSFSANWQSLSFPPSAFFNVTLLTSAASVPDMGSSMLLLALGILVLATGAQAVRNRQA
jgi:hypothetical protein